MKKLLPEFSKRLFSLLTHFLFFGVIIYFVWPILALYWGQKPAVGIDLFLSVDFVTYIHNHLSWPFLGWKYIWYSGTPLSQTYPLLHFYLMQPLLIWFSAVEAVQIYVLASYVILYIFSYLLFYSLSKSRPLSAVLSIGCAYSFNLWGQLYWAGSVPYTATLFVLPLSLFLVHRGFETENKKFIYLAALVNGIFLLGHPQSFVGYTVPLTTILILFFWDKKTKIFRWGKYRTLFIYGVIIFFVGFPIAGTGLVVFDGFLRVFKSIFSSRSGGVGQVASENFAAATSGTLDPVVRMVDIYTRSNPIFFWALGIGFVIAIFTIIITLLFKRRISQTTKLLLPFSLMFLYMLVFIYSFAKGLNPIAGGWYRVFWPTMFILGSFVAILWRVSVNNLEIIFENLAGKSAVYRKLFVTWTGIISLTVFVVGIVFLQYTYFWFTKETLGLVSESSAFPTVLSLNLKKGEWPERLPPLVPSWMNPNDINWRLYDMDATINIWWSSAFKMPLARGYLDAAPTGPNAENYSGWQYIQNTLFSKNEAVNRFGYSEEQAKAMSAFFIDWAAIKYWEGTTAYGRDYASPPSTYIGLNKDFIKRSGSVFTLRPAKYFMIEGRGWDIPDTQQELKYFEINDQITSPIYSSSNAPTILVIGDAIGQDTIMRDLGLLNFNSKRAIIVQWNKPIDKLPTGEIDNFDMIILYRYKYNSGSKAFSNLEKYVKNGGNLFVDTGTEQNESSSGNLFDLFPFKQGERKPLGNSWDFKIEKDPLTKGVNFKDFSEPMFDNEGWSFAYPVSELKYGAKVLVANHQKPVLVTYNLGKGKVVWSGMNFAGHLQRFKNQEELNLFKNIMFYFADFSKDKNVNVSFERPAAEKVIIKGDGSKGILFKEAAYPGWEVRVKGDGFNKKLDIYEAGPMVPGYMYSFLPKEAQGKPFEAVFEYKGETVYRITYAISFISVLMVLDYLLFRRRILRKVSKLGGIFGKRFGRWWNTEE